MSSPEQHENIISRRPVTPEDFEFARKVHHAAYHDVVVRQFGKWDEEAQNKFFEDEWNKEKSFEIISYDGVPCGLFAVEEKDNIIFGNELFLLQEFQGRGIGTKLINELIEQSRATHQIIKIRALKENKALELYHRLGFRDAGSTETHTELEFDPDRDGSAAS